jgi:Amidohydrolase
MEGKVALEEHFSTELNNRHWNAKSEEDRNGKAYAQDVERRLVDPGLCVAEMKGSKARLPPSYNFASNFYITTSGHFHSKPFHEAVAQIGAERVLFSVDYPYEQMDMGARWFNDMQLPNATKRLIGRENADRLVRTEPRLPPRQRGCEFGVVVSARTAARRSSERLTPLEGLARRSFCTGGCHGFAIAGASLDRRRMGGWWGAGAEHRSGHGQGDRDLHGSGGS